MRSKMGTTVLGACALAVLGWLGSYESACAQTCAPVGDCGDLDQSGKVNVTDALKLLKNAVGQPQELVCECAGEGSATCDEDLAACNADLDACLALPTCGDGVVEGGEDCDVGDIGGEDCVSQGFEGGTLACAYCAFDTDGCYVTRFDGSGPTVIDLETGLEWEKKNASDNTVDYANVHDADNDYTWCVGEGLACNVESAPLDGTIATVFLAKLNGTSDGMCYLGHCDWRLPTREELQSIALAGEDCGGPPCVADAALLPMRPNYYWSSTSYVLDASIAWLIDFANGSSSASYKPLEAYVRAVRSGS